jgi:hypothetical protein
MRREGSKKMPQAADKQNGDNTLSESSKKNDPS